MRKFGLGQHFLYLAGRSVGFIKLCIGVDTFLRSDSLIQLYILFCHFFKLGFTNIVASIQMILLSCEIGICIDLRKIRRDACYFGIYGCGFDTCGVGSCF